MTFLSKVNEASFEEVNHLNFVALLVQYMSGHFRSTRLFSHPLLLMRGLQRQ